MSAFCTYIVRWLCSSISLGCSDTIMITSLEYILYHQLAIFIYHSTEAHVTQYLYIDHGSMLYVMAWTLCIACRPKLDDAECRIWWDFGSIWVDRTICIRRCDLISMQSLVQLCLRQGTGSVSQKPNVQYYWQLHLYFLACCQFIDVNTLMVF